MRYFLNICFYLAFFIMDDIKASELKLSDEEKSFLSLNKTFTVHMEENYAPFSFIKNGRFKGFSVDYANLIASKLDVKFQYNKNETWSQAISNIKNGKIDIVAQMIDSERYRDFVIFTKGYMRYFYSIVVPKGKKDQLNTLESLLYKRVGVVSGYTVESIIRNKFPDINIVPYPDTKSLIDGVISGEIDAAISTHQVVHNNIVNRFITDIVSIPLLGNKDLTEVTESFGVQEKYPLLRSAMQKAINSLREEKIQLQKKWFGAAQAESNITLTNEEKLFIKNHGPIKYCIDRTWTPLEFLDDNEQHKGFSADILQQFSKDSGVKFELVRTKSWSESLEYIKQRRCDILPLAMPTKERLKYMSFTKPYFNLPLVMATKENVSFIGDFRDVQGKKFAIVKDYSYVETIKQNYDSVDLIEVNNIQEGLESVSAGKAFGFIGTVAVISQVIYDEDILGLKIAGRLKEEWNLGIGLRNDLPELRSIMDKNVDYLQNDVKQSILNRWIAVKYENGFDYKLFWQVLAIVFIAAAFLLLRYRYLSRMNSKLKAAYIELEQAKNDLVKLSMTDYLTGIYNRKKLDEVLANEINNARSFLSTLGIVLIDLDYFKSINDNYGHDIGDKVIIESAKVFSETKRDSDSVGRWGGEEFLIICPAIDREALIQFANQLLVNLENRDIIEQQKQTASIGIAMLEEGDSVETFLKRADDAMYKAKEKGRNRAEFQ